MARQPDLDFQIVSSSAEKSKICNHILHSLPEWFGIETAIKDYIEGVKNNFFLVATNKVEPGAVGFLSILDHNPYTSEIYVMGVLKPYQGTGLGLKLLESAEKEIIKQENKKLLMVKTLGESHPDPYYRRTRRFYKRAGFYPLEEMKTPWGEENPCLIMVKSLKCCL